MLAGLLAACSSTPPEDPNSQAGLDKLYAEAKDDLNKALPLYSKQRGPEAKALVEFQVQGLKF